MAKSKRTKATSITPEVRQAVRDRDKWCIFCGKRGTDTAHYIPRSRGGLGIVQNLVLACRGCHMLLDQSTYRPEMLMFVENYLTGFYGKLDRKELIYHK